jgi:hypothetical protein
MILWSLKEKANLKMNAVDVNSIHFFNAEKKGEVIFRSSGDMLGYL